jgi:hypothetical protein
MLEGLDAYQAGKQAPVKSLIITPVGGVGDDAYLLAVGDNVGLIVKKGNAAFKVAVYGQLPSKKTGHGKDASSANCFQSLRTLLFRPPISPHLDSW